MGNKHVVRAVLASLLALASLLTWYLVGRETAPATLPEAGPITPAEAEARLAEREAHAFEPPSATSAPGAPSAAPAPQSGPASASAQGLTISARLLDPAAHALAGGTLTWLGGKGLRPVPLRSARSDPAGAAFLRLEWNELDSTQPLVLALHAPEHLRLELRIEPARWMAEPVLNLGEVVLESGGRVTGRVVDEHGAGLADALAALTLALPPDPGVRAMARLWPLVSSLGVPNVVPTALSGPDGSFAIEGVPAGRFDVVAGAFGGESPLLPDRVEGVDVREGESASVRDLVLRPVPAEELVRGSVLAPDGTPVEGIWIALGDDAGSDIFEGRTFTGANGRFALAGMRDVAFRVLAVDAQGRWPQTDVRGAHAGGPEVTLRFEEPR